MRLEPVQELVLALRAMAKQAHDAGVSADTFKVLARLAWHDTKPARPVEVRS